MWAALFIALLCNALAATNRADSVSETFTLWDFCSAFSTECSLPLGMTRYAYGSGHEPGSSTWYLVGGAGQSMTGTNFEMEDNVIVVDLPSDVQSFETQCGSEYPQDLPFGLGQGAGAVIGDTLYSFGGFSGSPDYKYLDDVLYSDIVTESNFSSSPNSMPVPLSSACSVTVGHRVYLIGGLNNETITDQVFEYDASTDSWATLSPMTTSRFAPGCAHYDGKIFVFGGQTAGSASAYGPDLNSTEIYDIAQDSWTQSAATLSRSAHWVSATHLFLDKLDWNLILVMGGINGSSKVFDTLDVYHIESDSIVERNNMRTPRYAFQAIAPSFGSWTKDTVVIAGGKNGDGEVLSTVDAIYCRTAESTESVEEFPTAAISAGQRAFGLLAVSVVIVGTMSIQ